jgi:hypothetical protein
MCCHLAVEREANEAYEHYRAHGRDTQGRRLSRPPKPYEPPEIAAEVTASSPDFGHLQPMVEATRQELEKVLPRRPR